MKKPPQIKIETLEQEILAKGFLAIDRRKVKISYPQVDPCGIADQFMTVDSVVRKLNDAVCIVPWFQLNSEYYVYMRSCLRPAAGFRNYSKDSERPELDDSDLPNMWEFPAGLIDAHELGFGGALMAAQRELYEEIGLNVTISDLKELGPRYFSSAGMCAERIYFYEVIVDPFAEEVPGEDGSALELGGEVLKIKLTEALEALNNEEILDAKTQMGLMRLAKKLNISY